ncbi:MAG: phosphoglucosamine mutase, partial [Clostridia bacterium]|nr:phosphoglucosamine mutase [Clostridia bacterium]
MAIKFGTDGIRGIAYEELTQDVAYGVGNALARIVDGCRVAIGRDTRVSGEDLSDALINGLISAGGFALDCKLMPTAGVSYITKKYGCDFGVVIS